MDLDDAETRLALHLALRIADTLRAGEAEPQLALAASQAAQTVPPRNRRR